MRRALGYILLGGMILLQGWNYWSQMTLRLGPRVIMEPWLLHQGFVFYKDFVDMHTPLLPILLSFSSFLVHDAVLNAKGMVLVLVSLTTILVFYRSKKETDWRGGIFAAIFFILWSPTFAFWKLWHETLLAPLYLLLLELYLPDHRERKSWQLLAAGGIGGLAILTKQYAILVIGWMILWSVWVDFWDKKPWRSILLQSSMVVLGILIPILVFFSYQYARAGELTSSFYWLIGFSLFGNYRNEAASYPNLSEVIVLISVLILIPFILYKGIQKIINRDKNWIIEIGWLVLLSCASFTAFPRFDLFHFQTALPLIAILSVKSIKDLLSWYQKRPVYLIGIITMVIIIWSSIAYVTYWKNYRIGNEQEIIEYSELIPLSDDIQKVIGTTQSVYIVYDTEVTSNLYYLLDRPPTTFWVFYYPWFVKKDIMGKVVDGLKINPPDWMIILPDRWQVDGREAKELLDFIQDNYRLEKNIIWETQEVSLLKRYP